MPLVGPDSNLELAARIQKIERQLHAVMSQPNMIISNNTGQKVLSFGLQTVLPGGGTPTTSDPATFGLQLLDSAGAPIASFGEQPSTGTASLGFYDTAGTELLSVNSSALTAYNTAGDTEVVLGDVGNGIYGLAVRNPAGVLQMVSGRAYSQMWGTVLQNVSGSGNFNTTAPGPAFPSVTVTAGPSGLIDIEVGAGIVLNPTAAAAVGGGVNAVCTSDSSLTDLPSIGFNVVAAQASTVSWMTYNFSASTVTVTPGTAYTFNLNWITTPDVTMSINDLVLRAIPM